MDKMTDKEEKELENIEIIDYNIDESIKNEDEFKPMDMQKDKKKKSLIDELVSWAKMIVIAAVLALVFTQFIIINATVPTGSMENTIATGSRIMGLRLSYLFSDPERFDVIVFKFHLDDELAEVKSGSTADIEDRDINYVKRIIGLPGETVKINEGKISVYKGDKLVKGPFDESEYFDEEWYYKAGPYEFTVPKDSYFVLGDNRNHSQDTRDWYDLLFLNDKCKYDELFVKKEDILGKVYFTYFPDLKWIAN
jgi:signal peptidase I